jgi:hypothetical protein
MSVRRRCRSGVVQHKLVSSGVGSVAMPTFAEPQPDEAMVYASCLGGEYATDGNAI